MKNLFNPKMLKSKTFYLALLPMLAPLFPAFQVLLADPTLVQCVGGVFGALMVLVRSVTKKAVSDK